MLVDLEAIFLDIHASSSSSAEQWFLGLTAAMESLSVEPQRSPRTSEDPNLYRLLYGNKPNVYRILYGIDFPARTVSTLHIRHGARPASGIR